MAKVAAVTVAEVVVVTEAAAAVATAVVDADRPHPMATGSVVPRAIRVLDRTLLVSISPCSKFCESFL